MELSLQAALSRSRLKPELRTTSYASSFVQAWSSAFRLH